MADKEVILENLVMREEMKMKGLESLKRSLEKVKEEVGDLEKENDVPNSNLGELLYKADVLLDEIHICCCKGTRVSRAAEAEDGNAEVNVTNRIKQRVGDFFSCSNKTKVPPPLVRQAEKLSNDIEEQWREWKNELSTVNHDIDNSEQIPDPPQPYTRTKNKVLGRGRDQEVIVEKLLRAHKSKVSVYSIRGSSGLGKSALAELVYDDDKVKSHFDLRMWIRVYKIKQEREIIREIVNSCTYRRFTRQHGKPENLHSCVPRIQGGTFGDLLGCHSSDAIMSYTASNSEVEASYERRLQKHDLISLWIAQGFISPQQPANELEQNADNCFEELSRRCFFDKVVTDDDLRKIVTCKMHHTMRRIACKKSSDITSSYMTDSGDLLGLKCKHVSFTSDSDSLRTNSKTMLQAKNLRTLVSVKEPFINTKIGSSVLNELIYRFKCVRVLDLHDLGIEELPIFIGKLIHLRCLDLSKNGLLTLPSSITKLYSLQTLKLNSCTQLEKLSGNFGELVNLRCFEVDDCYRLTCMPHGLENLNQLKTLSRFVVGQDISNDKLGLKALKNLKNLEGCLVIDVKGDWTTNIPEDPQAVLSNKSDLVELKINWEKTAVNYKKKSNTLSEEKKKPNKKLLKKLQPNAKLKILSIEGYRGGVFPNWAGKNMLTTLPDLIVINIEDCDQCEHLPPFGKLPKLKELTLRHMANVKYIQNESFQGSSAVDNQGPGSAAPTFFPCLEKLTLHNFNKLEGWWNEDMMVTSEVSLPSFLHLKKLRIWSCPKLCSMPLFTQVMDLDLQNINQALLEESTKKIPIETNSSSSRNINQEGLEESLNQFSNDISSSSIGEINQEQSPNQIPNVPELECLQIKRCSNLKSFKTVTKGLGNLCTLRKLVIEKCRKLSSLTSEFSSLMALEMLEISYCKELDLSEDGSENVEFSSQWSTLRRLRHLTLRGIPKMKSLPIELMYVQTLKSLCISACVSLTELPLQINNLISLQHLRIESCNSITRLPDKLTSVTSLAKVEITECPELMENCKEGTGRDWEKIKHARVLLHKSWRHRLNDSYQR